jgi:hypothetical protein
MIKKQKDLYPEVYGYGSLEQLKNDPNNHLESYTTFVDADGDLRFVACTEEFFHFVRNEERNEVRRRDTATRCMVPSEKYGLVKCRADCKHCPFKKDKDNPDNQTAYQRTGLISIDYLNHKYKDLDDDERCNKYEKYLADNEQIHPLEQMIKEERTEKMYEEIGKLEEEGYIPYVKAVCWMRGEADSTNNSKTEKYETYLDNFINDLNSDLSGYVEDDKILFVDAAISESSAWTNDLTINQMKANVAQLDPEYRVYIDTIAMG